MDQPTTRRYPVWGIVPSVLLHLLVLLVGPLLVPPMATPVDVPPAIPVQLVQFAERTEAPQIQKTKQPPKDMAARPKIVKAMPPHSQAVQIPEFDAKLRAAEQDMMIGQGQSTAVVGASRRGGRATYSLKDYVRSQIVRHWNFDVAALNGARWVVAVHVVLAGDGTVSQADPVEDASLHANKTYRSLVKSIRDAVLVSSPLNLPPGLNPAQLDMVLEFDPVVALR